MDMATILYIVLNLIFTIAFVMYFLIITSYFYKNCGDNYRKFTIYWLDLWMIIFIISTLSSAYLLSQILHGDLINSIKHFMNFVYFVFIFVGLNNLVTNFVKSIFVYSDARDEKKQKDKVFNKKFHITIFLLEWIACISALAVYFNINEDKEIRSMYHMVLKFILILSCIVSIINIYCLNKIKKRINAPFKIKSVTFYADFLIYKTLLDLLLLVPFVIILLLQKMNSFFIMLNYFVWVIYLFISGNLNLHIDKLRRIKSSSNTTSNMFLMDLFDFNLGVRVKNNDRRYTIDEQNANTFSNIFQTLSNSNLEPMLNSISMSGIDIGEIKLNEKQRHYLPVNFFIIFKLIFFHFSENEKSYDNFEKIFKDLCDTDKIEKGDLNSLKSGHSRHSYHFLHASTLNTTQNVSNWLKSSNLVNSHSVSFDTLFNNLEDEDVKDQFENILKGKEIPLKSSIDPYNQSMNFHIDSLFNEYLIELIPLYQLYFRDILYSLDTDRNKSILKILFEKKYTDKNFNQFFTRDTFLLFEVYDCENDSKKDFLNKLEIFLTAYKDYLTERIKNWKQSFLPLIIGVYNIKYLDYDKIIVLYRHPLAFSPFLTFKYWINISLCDFQEKVSISTNFTEVIDVKELEIKDNIYLHKEDHREVFSALESDFLFFSKTDFKMNYAVNIFIINEVKQFLSSVRDSENENESNKSLVDDDSREFFHALRKTENFRETAMKYIEKSKRDYGSDVICSLDKLLTNYVVNTRYVIKIYFSGLFNNVQGDMNENRADNSSYLLDQVRNIVKCSNLEEEEEADIVNESKIENENANRNEEDIDNEEQIEIRLKNQN